MGLGSDHLIFRGIFFKTILVSNFVKKNILANAGQKKILTSNG